jgi:hypothetical protein
MPYNERQELLAVYGHNPVTLRTLVRDLSGEQIRQQGTGSELWSILEIVCHLRDTEESTLARVQMMVEEDHPAVEKLDAEGLAIESDYQSQSLDDALDAYERTRHAQIEYLKGLTDDQWQRTAEHDQRGEITIQSLTTHMALHDSVHFAQISRRIRELRNEGASS